MSKDNDNLDMQTFQIYTEEPVETLTPPSNNNSNKTQNNNVFSNTIEKTQNKNTELLKGLALGLGIALLFILIDMFFLSK